MFVEYGNIFAIYLFAIFIVPAVILGCMGRSIKIYGMLINIPIIYFLEAPHIKNFIMIVLIELTIVYIYFYIRKKIKSDWLYYIVLVVLIFPVLEVKIAADIQMQSWSFLGISYFGFRIWQLVIEIRDGHLDNINWWHIIYFVTFFPTISSGPIDRFRRFNEELSLKIKGEIYKNNYLVPGIKKIFNGMVYKFLIAENINVFWLLNIDKDIMLLNSIQYMYAYTLYLFFDFAGYSLMAVGVAYLLGVKVPDNFNKPFLARNMKEFWDRWHISLSKWFGDYLFSRLVLNLMRNKIVKKQSNAVRICYMITMLTMGMWHGFTLYYFLYGFYQGVMLVLSDMYIKSKHYRKHIKLSGYNWVSRVICFHIIAFGMLIFSGYLFGVK